MSKIRLNINGREVYGYEGQTILEIARNHGISVPTLCHDERVKMYGSCGICVVEAEGSPKLLRSCSTYAVDGMVINTESERVNNCRRTALELLLTDHQGDCRPPCVLACPAQTDCQGYVGLIANGEYKEALKLIKDKIPLPGSIGKICPHPCEEACRRKLVEEPISIAALKVFAADKDMESGGLYTKEARAYTGKKIAVIGGGPGGLTAAYFLRSYGHAVTVFDAMPHMGGMLRYGIPEYRLPKNYLQEEIDAIAAMGVEMKNNIKIGRDIRLDYLRDTYDAVIVAVGAWTSTSLRCPGEELSGVMGGIDFLQDVALGKAVYTGRKIAVVGGGNTAMDACRTAVRLGASKVYNIYRRTKAEMPAEDIEIKEAEEEGVIFKNLANPIEVIGKDGNVQSMRLQMMKLGEPDASGRRAPVPLEGQEETISVDTVIVAIGQKLDPVGLEGIELTKWNTISADEATFRTSLEGVFAIGDATNKGADIAISAIGEAKKAAEIIHSYLNGIDTRYEAPYLVTTNPTEQEFADRKKQQRAKMPHRSPSERRDNFMEVNQGLSEEDAVKEANRCLECGCHDYFECKLINYANQYTVQPERLKGEVHHRQSEDSHPFIQRNPDKCILCGLCVRVCDEVVGATALGLVDRGFDTIVKPALDLPLKDTGCVSCGQCVTVCPTGALTETMMVSKQVPTREAFTDTVCSFCSVGCKIRLAHTGDLLLRSLPTADKEENALLCMKGRFGFGELARIDRLRTPLLRREDGKLEKTSYEKAFVYINKKLQSLQSQFGSDSIAVAVSDRYTNEEALLIKEYANKGLHTENVYSFDKSDSGLCDVLGEDSSTTDFEQLEQTGLILLVNSDLRGPHGVAGMKIRRAVENGAKLIVLNGFDSPADEMADIKLNPGMDLAILKQILKAVMERAQSAKDCPGYTELADSLQTIEICEEAQSVADAYSTAKKAVIVFEQNTLTADAACILGDIALCAGHTGSPRSGIIQLKPGANSQGLTDLGVLPGSLLRQNIASGEIRGLVIFGEDVPDLDVSGLEFLAVQDLQLTETAEKAHVVLPSQSFAETSGTFTNSIGKVQELSPAVPCFTELSNVDLLKSLSQLAGAPMPYRNLEDIQDALKRAWSSKTPGKAKLVLPYGNTLLRSPSRSTNALYNSLMNYIKKKGGVFNE